MKIDLLVLFALQNDSFPKTSNISPQYAHVVCVHSCISIWWLLEDSKVSSLCDNMPRASHWLDSSSTRRCTLFPFFSPHLFVIIMNMSFDMIALSSLISHLPTSSPKIQNTKSCTVHTLAALLRAAAMT